MSERDYDGYFRREDALWYVAKAETEYSEQQMYRWVKVTAMWSGIGPRPSWAGEPRSFIFERCQLTDSSGNPLSAPRYVEEPR